jgi:hypothetical protein
MLIGFSDVTSVIRALNRSARTWGSEAGMIQTGSRIAIRMTKTNYMPAKRAAQNLVTYLRELSRRVRRTNCDDVARLADCRRISPCILQFI